MPDQQALILLVEDSEDDVVLIRRAFAKARVVNPIHVVRSGDDAIAYLSGDGLFANRAEFPLPELVLLDLKMPGVDGFDVLRWLRQQPRLNALRVVVLTSSVHMPDITKAYELGANSFLVKPLDFSEFIAIAHAIEGYWFWTSRAPDVAGPMGTPLPLRDSDSSRPAA